MKLIQVGEKKEKKSALMDVTTSPGWEFMVLHKQLFWHVKGCLSLYCYEAAKVSAWIPEGTSGQGEGLFSFLLSVSVLVRIISYIFFCLCIIPVHHCVL